MYIVLFYSSTLDTVHFAHLRGRRVWRYQMGNHNPYIEEEQTTQWPKEKVQKDKQRSSKHTHKTKDRVTRTPLKTGGELRQDYVIVSNQRLIMLRYYSLHSLNHIWVKSIGVYSAVDYRRWVYMHGGYLNP